MINIIRHTFHFTYQVDKNEENNETKLSAILIQNISTDVNDTFRFLCHFSIISFMIRPHAINDKLPPTFGMIALAFSNVDQSPMLSIPLLLLSSAVNYTDITLSLYVIEKILTAYPSYFRL